MLPYRQYYLIILFCAFNIFCSAQPTFYLKDQTQRSSIPPNSIEWFVDEDPNSGFDTIQDSIFSLLSKNQSLNSTTSSSLWAKFNLVNETGMDGENVLQIPKSGFAHLYIQNRKSYTRLNTGSLLPLKDRSLKAASNGFRFTVKNGEQISLWLQIKK